MAMRITGYGAVASSAILYQTLTGELRNSGAALVGKPTRVRSFGDAYFEQAIYEVRDDSRNGAIILRVLKDGASITGLRSDVEIDLIGSEKLCSKDDALVGALLGVLNANSMQISLDTLIDGRNVHATDT